MNFKQLEAFVTVAQQGSFSRAAQLLYTSPTALTQQLNALEREMGCRLLERTYRGTKMTAAGDLFYANAKELLRLADAAVRQCRSAGEKESSVITIGSYHENEIMLLQGYVRRFADICPDIRVDFYNQDHRNFYDLLEAGTLDLFVYPYDDFIEKRGLRFYEMGESGLCCSMVRNHPLAQKEQLEIEDLRNWPLIIGCGCKSRCLDGFREYAQEQPDFCLKRFETDGEVWKHILTQNYLMLNLDYSIFAEGNSVAVPLNWPEKYRYGIIYRADAKQAVRRFLCFMRETGNRQGQEKEL